MSDLVQIEPSVKFPVYAEPKELLSAKMIVGTWAWERIRQNYETKLPEVKSAELLGIPVLVSRDLKPGRIEFRDKDGNLLKAFECDSPRSAFLPAF